jgi:DNA-binding LacI/PurR family transcriptional regulator
MRFRRDIGIKEIAERAGVSNTTVSRVLRGIGEISDDTRDRIQRIANELGYRPNLAVRTMQTGRSQTVGVLMDITEDPGFRGEILRGIHDTLIGADHVPVLLWARPDTKGFSESDQVHRLVDHRVDGLIMSVQHLGREFIQYVGHLDLPVVLIDEIIDEAHRDTVITDNESGGREAARYLLDLGHESICYITDRQLDVHVDGGRGAAFCDEIRGRTGRPCGSLVVSRREPRLEDICALLTGPDPPSAIFAFNDYLALHAYRAAISLGLDVPGELSLLGFGNVPHVIDLVPTLSSFEQEPYSIGRIACELILERIASSEPYAERLVTVPPKLVIRTSTTRLRCHRE